MNEFENIQRLLRLKQYETPGDDFVEDFVTQFRERQRSELLRQSARGLLWERVNTFFSDVISPKWATATATAAFAIVAAWGTLGIVGSESHKGTDFAMTSAEPVAPPFQRKPAFALDSELIKEVHHEDQANGFGGILLSQHFESDSLADREMDSFSDPLTPISAEMLPVSDFGH